DGWLRSRATVAVMLVLAALIRVPAVRASSPGLEAPSTHRVVWPTFQFDNQRTGVNPHETLLDPTNVGGPALAWSATAPGFLRSTPVVAYGLVFTDSNDGEVEAWNEATGAPVWHTAMALSTGPTDLAVADGRIFVGDIYGSVYALDARSGSVDWAVDLGGELF